MTERAGQPLAEHNDSLEELVTTSGPLPPLRVAAIGRDLLDALRAAHAAGAVLSGVQPANVLIGVHRTVLKDSDTGGPEDDPVRPRIAPAATAAPDLWSLGATLFYALEGYLPVEGADADAAHAGLLAPVIDGLLCDDPARRLTADAASQLLERVLRNAVSGSEMAIPCQLPAAIQGFVGRTEQLDELTQFLDEPLGRGSTVVISAVIGAAGVGKTALAVQWTQRVQDRFPDGQLYVDLRGYDPGPPMTPEQALDGFLRALGVPGEKIPAGVEAKAELYRSLLDRRRVLVVLDNVNTAEQVFPLLPGSAGCVAVVTSRNRLSDLVTRDDTHALSLGLLTPAEAIALLAQSIGATRVDAEPGAATELAGLCACLPLALRIAAGRVAVRPDMTLADLVAELADERVRLDALASDDDQSTAVRAAFSWSYRALPAQAARVFRLLGVHAGPDVSAPAAAALTGTSPAEVRQQLDVLAGAHMLEETAQDRYRFHDLLRLYAVERAAETPEAERTAAAQRVLTWYLHTAAAAVRAFSPIGLRVPLETPEPDVAYAPLAFTDKAQALEWCEAERVNLVAATRHAAECGLNVLAWKLPAVLWDFFSLRGHWTDWITTHDIGLAAAQQVGDKLGEAWMENNLGNAYRGLGQFDEALDHFHRALAINLETGHRQGEGWTRYNIGDTYRELGRFEEALSHLRQALLIGREVGERWSEGYTLNMIGETYRGLGQYEEALRHLMPALVINRELGHRRGEGFTLNMIGDTHQERRRFDQALNYYQQALTVRREFGDRRGEALTLHGIGDTYRKRRQLDEALTYYQQALAIHREIGDGRGEARTLSSMKALHSRVDEGPNRR